MPDITLKTLAVDDNFSLPALIKTVKDTLRDQASGRICLHARTDEHWWLDFADGQLLWASGGTHRFRRWQRLLRTVCPDVQPSQVRLREPDLFDHWEYVALSVLLQRQQIESGVAVAIIQQTLSEVLFDIFHAVTDLDQITQAPRQLSPLTQSDSLGDSSLFYQVGADLQAWQATGLGHASPNLAPVLDTALTHDVPPSPTLLPLLQGKRSLRDLSQILGRDLPTLGRSLASYVESNQVAFKPMADLSAPYAELESNPSTQTDQPLVFCLDSSPQMGFLMEDSLQAAGYRCLSLQDSVQALVQIIRHKPQIIFLNLIMPIVNGYEICQQIRRAKAFRHTPIIMLTDNDSFMDRARAKAAGATAFMAKPLDPSKVVAVVEHHLAKQDAERV